MGGFAASVTGRGERAHLTVDAALLAGVALCLILQAWLALRGEISWDEFYFLSQIYDFQRGELTIALQTFHVHLLGWLTGLPGNEVEQINAGRLAMLACETATCALIYALSRSFFDRTASLLAVLAYVSAGFTMVHGASFRTDPLAAAPIMAALVLIGRAPLAFAAAAAAALCAALATLVTVKVVLYAPAFLGLVLWRWSRETDRGKLARWLVGASLGGACLLAALYALHLSGLPVASNTGSQAIIGGAARTTLLEAGLLPRAQEIGEAVLDAPAQVALLILGAAGAIAANGTNRLRNRIILLCAAPLLSLLFYRNAFAYFFPFILPPATLLVANAVASWPVVRRFAMLIGAALTISAAAAAAERRSYDQAVQRQLVTAVHRIFPRPVHYIDRNGMIGSFPKRGFFMSTWGRQNYRRGAPVFARVLAEDRVPLLIANSPSLEHALGLRSAIRPDLALFSEDRLVLRNNYIPHWGAIWVAGQRVRVGPSGQAIQIAVPGPYTIEENSVEVDGRSVAPGDVVNLDRGRHVLRSHRPTDVILRWGDHLYRPPEPPGAGPVYRGF